MTKAGRCKVGCPKMARKTFLAEVVIVSKSDKVPDFGLGKGVLSQQEITFNDAFGRGFNNPTFAMALVEHEDRLIRSMVGVRWTEVKKGKKK